MVVHSGLVLRLKGGTHTNRTTEIRPLGRGAEENGSSPKCSGHLCQTTGGSKVNKIKFNPISTVFNNACTWKLFVEYKWRYGCTLSLLPPSLVKFPLSSHCSILQAAMVHYEIALILRAVGKQELSSVLKGVCTTLMQNGAILRKLENLGEKELPYRINSRKGRFTHGRYDRLPYSGSVKSVT